MRRADDAAVRGTALVLLSAICFASLSVVTLLILRTGTPLIVALQWRFSLAAVMLAVLAGRDLLQIPKRARMQLFAAGMLGQTAVTFVSLSALHYIGPATLTFLFFSYPAWLAAAGAISGRVPLRPARILALGLALAGTAILVRPGAADLLDLRGVALALGAAVLYAAYLPLLSRLQRGIRPMTAAFFIIAGAALTFNSVSLVGGYSMPATSRAWLFIGILVLVPTVFAFALLIAGVARLGAVRTSIVGAAEPFFTAILATLILGDRIRATTLVGGTLIVVAVIVNARARAAPADLPSPALNLDREVL